MHFNSQPHEEADVCNHGCDFSIIISTHSLTKRLTIFRLERDWYDNISTHSLTKRLTTCRNYSFRAIPDFNSQPHEEADILDSSSSILAHISTHSLTKRLTQHRNL